MSTAPLSLPPGLRARVLASSTGQRPPGRSLPEVPDISPAEAFARAADALADLLGDLTDPDWHRWVLRNLDVQGLTGHLLGVERAVQRALAGDPAVAGADHVTSTQATAVAQARRAPEETLAAWRSAVDHTLALVADRPAGTAPVAVHGLRLPVGPLLVVRTFELWTHENDIRRTTGRPATAPDPSMLRLMTALAVRALPQGVARAGAETPALDVHLVLTGPGGGTWEVALGLREAGTADVPEVTMVLDAVDFCRLVADRVQPDDLTVHLGGAVSRAGEVLAGAAALALD